MAVSTVVPMVVPMVVIGAVAVVAEAALGGLGPPLARLLQVTLVMTMTVLVPVLVTVFVAMGVSVSLSGRAVLMLMLVALAMVVVIMAVAVTVAGGRFRSSLLGGPICSVGCLEQSQLQIRAVDRPAGPRNGNSTSASPGSSRPGGTREGCQL